MSEYQTHCIMCFKEIGYNEEEALMGKPIFCSNHCSRKHFKLFEMDPEEWYEV